MMIARDITKARVSTTLFIDIEIRLELSKNNYFVEFSKETGISSILPINRVMHILYFVRIKTSTVR
jgi:hypothetical protein